MAVFEHVRRNDEAPPCDEPLWRWKSFRRQAERYRAAWLREQARQRLWRKSLVRARDGEEHGIQCERIDAIQRSSNETSQAPGLGALDECEQWTRRVVMSREHEAVDAGAAGIEEVVRAVGGHADVGDEREPRQPLLELAHAFEIWRLLPVQVHHGDAHWLAVADADECRPIRALV